MAVGYVVCGLIASAMVAIRVDATGGAARQSAGGMYGFGDAVMFAGVFGVCALVPTSAALVMLRTNRPFWRALSASGLTLAATGVVAAILFGMNLGGPTSRLAQWSAISVLRILATPLVALAFLMCAGLSPSRGFRFSFLIAAAVEVAVGVFGAVDLFLHWR